MKKKEISVLLVFVILILFLFSMTVYYFANQEDFGRRGDLVGDGICGNFQDKAGQDFCCSKAHNNDITPACVGSWEYISGTKMCLYVCKGTRPACPEDAKICENGSAVGRNTENECRFYEC